MHNYAIHGWFGKGPKICPWKNNLISCAAASTASPAILATSLDMSWKWMVHGPLGVVLGDNYNPYIPTIRHIMVLIFPDFPLGYIGRPISIILEGNSKSTFGGFFHLKGICSSNDRNTGCSWHVFPRVVAPATSQSSITRFRLHLLGLQPGCKGQSHFTQQLLSGWGSCLMVTV